MIRPLACALVLLSPAAAFAQTDGTPDAARSAIEASALALDTDGDGRLAPAEIDVAVTEMFPSLDADGSGAVDRTEFEEWPFGFHDMAAHRDRAEAYHAVFGLLFDLFDRGGDGRLDLPELREGMAAAAAYADRDGDGAMSRTEFLRGFVPNVALRHAMRD
ncbi:EF-hand domain-containing protein [Jannaschia sp. W003]|uniref:EF-hand domain-containing protein n=1 Tax=Jannaschia sp. W003 TaxID=2867012 RepID=UPI0021A71425|nr:hypothetical protein [Jannaschia sp. W003]UWQ20141.1 hypothetical protein K3554_08990 [Jannaschia sp. W003]